VRLHDYGCSLKAYRREVIRDMFLCGEMHRFLTVYAAMRGARVTEIPVTHHPRTRGRTKYGLERIIGQSPAMQEVFDTIRQAGPSRANVLVEGESGTG
jgi:transcriptional regulator with AAA-type ATPase domain